MKKNEPFENSLIKYKSIKNGHYKYEMVSTFRNTSGIVSKGEILKNKLSTVIVDEIMKEAQNR